MSFDKHLYKTIKDLSDRMRALETKEPMRPPLIRYQTDVAQSVANNTTVIIDFEDEIYDPLSLVTTGAAWKFTADLPGYFWGYAGILFDDYAWDAGEQALWHMYKNGALFSSLDRWYAVDQTTLVFLNGGSLVYLANGDYIDFRVRHDRGAATALVGGSGTLNHVNIFRL